jgi:AraC-like DNA-binding protein
VLDSRVLLDGPGLRVARVSCPGHERRFGPVEQVTAATVVLPCRGVFRLRVNGRERVVDPATAYLQWPGDEEQFAHPAGGDLCTAIRLGPEPAAGLAADDLVGLAHRPVPVAPRLAVAHRLLLSRARSGADRVELTDLTAALVAELLAALTTTAAPGPAPHGRATAALARQRRLIEDARERLSCDPDRALPDLAAALGTSPWRLSRLFHQVTGVTLHRYRTRLRVCAALDRLADGAESLAGLAAELGFADQAHLSRVVRQSTGLPPGRLRALLAPAPAGTR